MSADRWAVCPQCKSRREESLASEEAALGALYGKTPRLAYLDRVKRLDAMRAKEMPSTLREDYFQGMDDTGVYTVSYEANCSVCKFKWGYRHQVGVFD